MFEAELKLALNAVDAAAAYLESLSSTVVHSMEGKDIKLEADRESEALLLQALAPSALPVLSEEVGAVGAQDGMRWIIDPLDGSYNFYRGLKELACVSLALWDGERPLVGVVRRLGLIQTFSGNVTTKEAFLNGRAIQTSRETNLERAALATGFPVSMDYSEENLQTYIHSARLFKKVRMLGAAALMSAFVGAGFFDVYCERSIHLWDVAAGIAVTLAAGGALRLLDTDDATRHVVLCANETLLAAVEHRLFT